MPTLRATIVNVGLGAAALRNDAWLQKDTGKEAPGRCRVNLFNVCVESLAAGCFVERISRLFEYLRTLLTNQKNQRLSQFQAGFNVLIATRFDHPFLEGSDLGTKRKGFA